MHPPVGPGFPAITFDAIRAEIERMTPRGAPSPTSVDLPVSSAVKRALRRAEKEANESGQEAIGIEHLLLMVYWRRTTRSSPVFCGNTGSTGKAYCARFRRIHHPGNLRRSNLEKPHLTARACALWSIVFQTAHCRLHIERWNICRPGHLSGRRCRPASRNSQRRWGSVRVAV